MYNEEALKLLFQTAIGDYLGKQERLGGTGTIALPDNFNIHDLEKFQPVRRRFRGAYTTKVLADFVAYVIANAPAAAPVDAGAIDTRNVQGYVDAEAFAANVIFNLYDDGLPGHADWIGSLKLDKTAAYNALLAINGKPQTQQQAIDWLEDWGGLIEAQTDVGGLLHPMTLGNAIAAIRQIKISAKREEESGVGNLRTTGSMLDEVAASSRLELPAVFHFKTAPYLGLTDRDFELQLRILTGDDKPKLVLRISYLEAVQEAIVTEFKEVLFRELDGRLPLYVGKFQA